MAPAVRSPERAWYDFSFRWWLTPLPEGGRTLLMTRGCEAPVSLRRTLTSFTVPYLPRTHGSSMI